MTLPSYRVVNLAQSIASLMLVVVAVAYFEKMLQLEPCYLCMIQRAFVIAIGTICIIAVIHNPQQLGQRIYSALSIIIVFMGIYFFYSVFDIFNV